LSWPFGGQHLTEIGGEIGWLASGMNFRFKKPVYFGDSIECCSTITEIDDRNRANAEAQFKNQHNEIVIEAYLMGIIPDSAEKRVMQTVMAERDSTNNAVKAGQQFCWLVLGGICE
jgi:3-hydroxybutyryl-CoA dehydratase